MYTLHEFQHFCTWVDLQQTVLVHTDSLCTATVWFRRAKVLNSLNQKVPLTWMSLGHPGWADPQWSHWIQSPLVHDQRSCASPVWCLETLCVVYNGIGSLNAAHHMCACVNYYWRTLNLALFYQKLLKSSPKFSAIQYAHVLKGPCCFSGIYFLLPAITFRCYRYGQSFITKKVPKVKPHTSQYSLTYNWLLNFLIKLSCDNMTVSYRVKWIIILL